MPIKYITCKDCGRKVPYYKAVASPDNVGYLCEDCYNSRKASEKAAAEKERQKKDAK